MNPALVTSLAVIVGSIVGGATTFATAWLTQRVEGEREAARLLLDKRERLYSEFIVEVSKLAIDSMDHSLDDPAKFYTVAALRNRIRLLAGSAVLAEADRVVTTIVQQYAARNLREDEMRAMALRRTADPIKPFSEACRAELLLLRTSAMRTLGPRLLR